jgi:hypothetical protein
MKNAVFVKQKKLYPFKVPCMSGRVKSRDSSTPVISLVGPGFERCSVHNLTILCTKGGVCSSSPPELDALGSTIAVSTDAISNGISTRIESQSSKVHWSPNHQCSLPSGCCQPSPRGDIAQARPQWALNQMLDEGRTSPLSCNHKL